MFFATRPCHTMTSFRLLDEWHNMYYHVCHGRDDPSIPGLDDERRWCSKAKACGQHLSFGNHWGAETEDSGSETEDCWKRWVLKRKTWWLIWCSMYVMQHVHIWREFAYQKAYPINSQTRNNIMIFFQSPMFGLIFLWNCSYVMFMLVLKMLSSEEMKEVTRIWRQFFAKGPCIFFRQDLHHFLREETFFSEKDLFFCPSTHFHTQSIQRGGCPRVPMCRNCTAKEKRCRALWNVMIAPLLMYLACMKVYLSLAGLFEAMASRKRKWTGLGNHDVQRHSFKFVSVDAMIWSSFWSWMYSVVDEDEGDWRMWAQTVRAKWLIAKLQTFFGLQNVLVGKSSVQFLHILHGSKWLSEWGKLKVRFVHCFYTHTQVWERSA